MTKTCIALFLAASAIATAAPKNAPDLVVFIHGSAATPTIKGQAEGQAQRMLASTGIVVAWSLGELDYHGSADVVEAVLVDHTDPGFKPGSLAVTTLGPTSHSRIEIFYGRLQNLAGPSAVSTVLAHVLVHEITHVLEGIPRHSASGVMKARWSASDIMSMRYPSLAFDVEDVALLHAWLARHHQTVVAGLR